MGHERNCECFRETTHLVSDGGIAPEVDLTGYPSAAYRTFRIIVMSICLKVFESTKDYPCNCRYHVRYFHFQESCSKHPSMRENILIGRHSTTARARASLCALVCALSVWLAFSAPTLAADLTEDDLLLLDVVMERQILAASATAYTLGTTAVVSLSEYCAALEFPVSVDAAAGTAIGWFIRPERIFKLDLKRGVAEVAGKRMPFSQDEVFVHQGAIFVSIETLARWFPVDLLLKTATLSLEATPRERLPMQERAARRQAARENSSVTPASLPLIATPYRLLGPQVADVSLGYYSINSPANAAGASRGANYSALVGGDVAYMDSHLYLNGNQNSILSDARLSLSRDKLGLPWLRYVEVGDIVPAIVSGLSYNGVERGFLLQGGGSAVGRDDLINSDTIHLSGNSLPGWDVELFQNGMHIGYQTIGVDGRYNFANIDPLAGENKFELVFYGPAGERRTETVIRNSGLGPDQPGSVRYQFSASQQGEHLYRGSDTAYLGMSDVGATRLAGGVDVRVLQHLSLRSAWNNLMVNGQRLNYASLGATTDWHDFSLKADATHDPLHGTIWNGSLQLPAKTNLWGFDTRFSYTQYAQSVLLNTTTNAPVPTTSTTNIPTTNVLQLSSRAGVTLNGPIGPTRSEFSLFHNHGADRDSNNASAGFTARAGKFTFGNTLNYYRFGPDTNGVSLPDQLTGNAFFSTSAVPLSLRGGLTYALKPQTQAYQYFLDSNLSVAKDMTMNFGLTYAPLTGVTEYSSGLNWQLPQVTLSPRVTYDNNGTYSGFIYASFSLAPRPDRSGTLVSGTSLVTAGTVAARVYLDNDASGSFTPGDEPLANVTVRAPQAVRSGTTDAHGMAYLTGLTLPRATDIVLDEATLPSTQMQSTNPGNSVLPRPAAFAVIDFPVIPTGEIEGHVYTLSDGKRVPLAGAMVELRDSAGKVTAFKNSSHDGYYLFESVPYADYRLNLGGERREKSNQPRVVLNHDHASHSHVDLLIGAYAATVFATPKTAPAAVAVPLKPATPTPATVAVKPTPPPPANTPAAKPTPPPVFKPKTKPTDGRLVQLGAFANLEAAQAYRKKLQGLTSMESARIDIVTVDLGNFGYFHRVVATPFETSAEALCASLKARGTECFTIEP